MRGSDIERGNVDKVSFSRDGWLTLNFLSDSLLLTENVVWSNEDVGRLLGVLVWISGLKTSGSTDAS